MSLPKEAVEAALNSGMKDARRLKTLDRHIATWVIGKIKEHLERETNIPLTVDSGRTTPETTT